MLGKTWRKVRADPPRVVADHHAVERMLVELQPFRGGFQLSFIDGAQAQVFVPIGSLFEGIHGLEQALKAGFHPGASFAVKGSSGKCVLNSAAASPWVIGLVRLFQESSSWRT